ncbi:DeoR/GlpR family DNA-binding transcription regulator [Mycetocola miduiensis]|uniref:Transcriptional regulator, DeoR family n=1 Tax=Mycetocola miduiensis TaxID=995034 RepID=A0A1I4ZIR0_9MICO|nr:DeoR/GlpR family DNA-binding transcription regulator [Mycetocola miduiensis]SFN50098.1 transcriptional regulator, DeoR family [Mycetocola miduiensis]
MTMMPKPGSEDPHTASQIGSRSKVARLHHITEMVRNQGFVAVDILAETLDVSRMTIHRDLDDLERSRVLRKVRGGASVERTSTFESDFDYRANALLREKQFIAAAAAALANDGDVVVVDDSSTTTHVIQHLRNLEGITVVSNSLPVIEEVTREPGLNLITLGGQFRPRYQCFLGLLCEKSLADLYADILFASSSAVLGTDVFHQDEPVVKAKQAMMRASRRRVLMVDHTKLGRGALHRVGSVADFTDVVVDERGDPSLLDAIRETGVNVIVVPVPHRLNAPETP